MVILHGGVIPWFSLKMAEHSEAKGAKRSFAANYFKFDCQSTLRLGFRFWIKNNFIEVQKWLRSSPKPRKITWYSKRHSFWRRSSARLPHKPRSYESAMGHYSKSIISFDQSFEISLSLNKINLYFDRQWASISIRKNRRFRSLSCRHVLLHSILSILPVFFQTRCSLKLHSSYSVLDFNYIFDNLYSKYLFRIQ